MRKLLLLGFVVLLICQILPAQQPLDNNAIIKLTKAGLSDDQIITTINASPCSYDVSTDGQNALRAGGVSEKVLAAVVVKEYEATTNAAEAGTNAAPSTASPASPKTPIATANSNPEPAPARPATGPNGLPIGIDDVGVYYRDNNGAWVSMLPEIVNFQSKGKITDIVTAGILKGDLDGRIEGSHSRVVVALPVVFAVYLPETFDITEYVLLELHPTANARTFLSAEGGLLHTKPDAHEDQIDFQPEKLAPRLYQITLPAIEGKGEYGLLAPGTKITSSKEATGKIYAVSATE